MLHISRVIPLENDPGFHSEAIHTACGETKFTKDDLRSAYAFYAEKPELRCKECFEDMKSHLPVFVGWGHIVYD